MVGRTMIGARSRLTIPLGHTLAIAVSLAQVSPLTLFAHSAVAQTRVEQVGGARGRAAQGTQGKKDEPRYPSAGPGHFVKEVREGGRFIVLEDKSLWEVPQDSRYRTAEWQELEGLAVRFADNDPPFSYELTNIDRDEGVGARWVRPDK